MKLIPALLLISMMAIGQNITYHVSVRGDDFKGTGTQLKPWRTLKYAASKVPANQDVTIKLGKGIFVEDLMMIPEGVNIEGMGVDLTILKSSVVYNPVSPGYALDKFLLSFVNNSQQSKQKLSKFTIDGDGKKLHGGIYIRYRSNIEIKDVKIKDTNFTGMWLWDVSNSTVNNVQINNAAWGSNGYSSGALNVGNLKHVTFDNLDIDESVGYGIKAIGPNVMTELTDVKILNSRISVNPTGLWVGVSGVKAPNIAIEFWKSSLVGCEIADTYVDNTISLVSENSLTSKGIQTIRVHHNTIDIETRAKGTGYGIELSIHDAEIDNNKFIKGTNGIVNWAEAKYNWSIHHNEFIGLTGKNPGEAVRSQKSGLHNVKFYHNKVEFIGVNTMNVIGLYGGVSENIDIKNNEFIDNNTAYSSYPSTLIHIENAKITSGLVVQYNSFKKLPIGAVPGGNYSMNITTPGINLIGKGINLGYGKNIGTY